MRIGLSFFFFHGPHHCRIPSDVKPMPTRIASTRFLSFFSFVFHFMFQSSPPRRTKLYLSITFSLYKKTRTRNKQHKILPHFLPSLSTTHNTIIVNLVVYSAPMASPCWASILAMHSLFTTSSVFSS